MRRRVLAVGALVAAVVAFAVIATGDDPYRVTLELDNANGLESGSPVVVGGLTIGTVELDLRDETVLVHADIDRRHAPVGRDVKATIVAQNLLGMKQLRLDPGTRSEPLPDGATLPASAVSRSTDLDQVLDVLGPDTRARLAVLMNEAGLAVTGREVGIDTFIGNLPEILQRGAALADDLASENDVLAELVTRTDRYVDTVTRERRSLTRLVDTAGEAATTVAERRAGLRSSLRRAPAALGTLRTFLTEVEELSAPLGRTARRLQMTAAPLRATLTELPDVARAASPTLRSAAALAPDLDRLATEATPFLEGARPTLASAEKLATVELGPTADIVDGSWDNLLAILENWSRAIQYRDRLSHVFRAELAVPITSLTTMVDRLRNASESSSRRRARGGRPSGPRPAPAPSGPAPSRDDDRGAAPATPVLPPLEQVLPALEDTVDGIVGGLVPKQKPSGGGGAAPQSELPLLDFLLEP